MGKSILVSWPSHAQQLTQGLWKSLHNCFKTDFVISVKGNDGVSQLVKAHTLILSIFCSSICNSEDISLEFDSTFDEEDLLLLLEFIYKGKTKIPIDKMGNVKLGARRLGLSILVDTIDKCEQYERQLSLKDNVNIESEKKLPTGSCPKEERKRETEVNSDTIQKVPENTLKRKFRQKKNKIKKKLDGSDVKSNVRKTSELVLANSQDSTFFDYTTQKCNLCDKVFHTRHAFSLHVSGHLEPEKMRRCPHCPVKFSRVKSLVNHVALKHSMDMEGKVLEKKFRCDECEYSSVLEFCIRNHKSYKHGLKPHKCDQCSYSSYVSADVAKHKEAVHGDNSRPYMCDSCGYTAKTKTTLRSHLIIHKEKIPCDVCGGLYQAGTLPEHKRRIHCQDKRAFKCPLCNYATSCNAYLRTHIIKVHKLSPAEYWNIKKKVLES